MTETPNYQRFAPVVRALPGAALRATALPGELLLDRDGDLAVYYAPFDVVNPEARIVLVGITPGLQQAQQALDAFRSALDSGSPPAQAAVAAKRTASFSGSMRPNLVAMLDYFGVNRWLGIGSSASLFTTDAHLVHYTSALRYPVFYRGANYNGTPSMVGHPLLRKHLFAGLGEEARQIPRAIWVPLGAKVSEGVRTIVSAGLLAPDRVLDGLEHPSGANNERVQYLIGRKRRDDLSRQTNAARIDEARDAMRLRMQKLLADS